MDLNDAVRAPTDLPPTTFESQLCYGSTLQRRAIFATVRYAADLAPTFFRDETDVQLQHLAHGYRMFSCPFVYALDLKRPANAPAGGCHTGGTLFRYDLMACRNNWRVLKRHKATIRSKLNIGLPLFALQAIFIAERLGYRLPRKIVGHILRTLGLRR